jgi:hypothetical protein
MPAPTITTFGLLVLICMDYPCNEMDLSKLACGEGNGITAGCWGYLTIRLYRIRFIFVHIRRTGRPGSELGIRRRKTDKKKIR